MKFYDAGETYPALWSCLQLLYKEKIVRTIRADHNFFQNHRDCEIMLLSPSLNFKSPRKDSLDSLDIIFGITSAYIFLSKLISIAVVESFELYCTLKFTIGKKSKIKLLDSMKITHFSQHKIDYFQNSLSWRNSVFGIFCS